ncbi:outer membrane beta-barrel protein [Tunturibacter empetritectus]|uniref:Opacity protein-like surface antigen n=1 Tax=Tunturiibacter lichenicola TaxID=2051959 RepID=A0A7W8JBJ7_9BACT|nr:outer membrane beta-barrel protein [Edaphobacter lichenicola]MBB5346150.1 opacity protein-like surface antigen [Edaphobacter lichenicola]
MSNRSTSKKIAKLANNLLPGIKISALLCLISFAATRLDAQALPTATSAGVLQAGGEFNYANSDYVPQKIKGGGAYVNFDFKYHWGIEAEFHQINDSDPTTQIYERTYEIGPRYVLHFGRIEPFAKVMYGRGVFRYPEVPSLTPGGPPQGNAAILAYNIGAAGIGVDYRLTRSINVRAEYEFQRWFGFPINGISPQVLGIGAAYRFH